MINLDKVSKELLDSFNKAVECYDEENRPRIICGYRSADEQRAIRKRFGYPDDDKPSGWNGLPLAARPGHSKHEKGLAIDIFNKNWIKKDYEEFYGVIKNFNSDVYWLGEKSNDYVHFELLVKK